MNENTTCREAVNKESYVPTAGINAVQNEVLTKGEPTTPGRIIINQPAENCGCEPRKLLLGVVWMLGEVTAKHTVNMWRPN